MFWLLIQRVLWAKVLEAQTNRFIGVNRLYQIDCAREVIIKKKKKKKTATINIKGQQKLC